jgi:membrane protein
VATVLSVVTLLLGASGVFGQLQDALNTIWEVKPKPNQGIWGFIRTRFLSFAMVLGIGFLLLVSLLLSSALAFMGSFLDRMPEQLHFLAQALNFVFSTAVITLLFALMFKLLPDVKMAWRDVWLGAFVTAVLFSIGKILIGLYLGHSAMASSYGVAGSFVVLLVWVYYSAQILFFGAELTQVYANRYGSRIVPDEHAVPITENERAQEGRPRKSSSPEVKPAT